MYRRRLTVLLLASLWPLLAQADSLLHDVAGRLAAHDLVQGEFRQSKQLEFLRMPLVSTGRFRLDAGDGLLWQVREPLASEMRVVDGLVTLDGEVVDDRGVGRLMAQIMGAFLGGDLAGALSEFDVSGSVAQDGWQLRLDPRSLILRTAIGHLDLRGDSFLESIVIHEQDGTTTVLEFFNLVEGAAGG